MRSLVFSVQCKTMASGSLSLHEIRTKSSLLEMDEFNLKTYYSVQFRITITQTVVKITIKRDTKLFSDFMVTCFTFPK